MTGPKANESRRGWRFRFALPGRGAEHATARVLLDVQRDCLRGGWCGPQSALWGMAPGDRLLVALEADPAPPSLWTLDGGADAGWEYLEQVEIAPADLRVPEAVVHAPPFAALIQGELRWPMVLEKPGVHDLGLYAGTVAPSALGYHALYAAGRLDDLRALGVVDLGPFDPGRRDLRFHPERAAVYRAAGLRGGEHYLERARLWGCDPLRFFGEGPGRPPPARTHCARCWTPAASEARSDCGTCGAPGDEPGIELTPDEYWTAPRERCGGCDGLRPTGAAVCARCLRA